MLAMVSNSVEELVILLYLYLKNRSKYCTPLCVVQRGVPSVLPRLALGGYSPLTTLTLVAEGLDVLDSTLPCLAADRGAALIFHYTTDNVG